VAFFLSFQKIITLKIPPGGNRDNWWLKDYDTMLEKAYIGCKLAA
jgi:hypothetical protein